MSSNWLLSSEELEHWESLSSRFYFRPEDEQDAHYRAIAQAGDALAAKLADTRAAFISERRRMRDKLLSDAEAYQAIGNGLAASALINAANEIELPQGSLQGRKR